MLPTSPSTSAVAPPRCGWTARGRAGQGPRGNHGRHGAGDGIAPPFSGGGLSDGRLARRRGIIHAPHVTHAWSRLPPASAALWLPGAAERRVVRLLQLVLNR